MSEVICNTSPLQYLQLAAFMQQLTNTHVKRWKEHHHAAGAGLLYQGRYRTFPVEAEDHFYQAVRYVKRNALRANLVERAASQIWWLSPFRSPKARHSPTRCGSPPPQSCLFAPQKLAIPQPGTGWIAKPRVAALAAHPG